MILTNLLSLTGTIGCAIAPVLGGTTVSVYTILMCFRFVLGVGVGGKYPLASALRARNPDSAEEHRAKEVAQDFFWQTPGAILPYVISSLLLLLLGEPSQSNRRQTVFQYMVLIGFGALPSLVALVGTIHELKRQDQDICGCFSFRRRDPRGGYQPIRHDNPVLIAFQNRSCWKKLAGTGLCWALYDFVYFGTAFNIPEIFSSVLGGGDDLLADSWHNALIASMGLPGVVSAIYMMEPIGGTKKLQWWGFVSIGVASSLMAMSYQHTKSETEHSLSPVGTWIAILACSLLIFTINWGCNVSTYVLPIEVFPYNVCSTFHGLSAGMGKCGAALGGFFFTQLNAISVSLTFTVCVVCCTAGAFITYKWIDDTLSTGRGTLLAKQSSSSLQDEAEMRTILDDSPLSRISR